MMQKFKYMCKFHNYILLIAENSKDITNGVNMV